MDLSFIKEWRPEQVKLVVVEDGGTNIEHQENHYGGKAEKGGNEAGKTPDNPLILDLMSICNDNEEYAAEFLKAVENKSALEITEVVKKFREEKKVSAQLCHHKLWQLLYDNKIYKLTERNWNARIGY